MNIGLALALSAAVIAAGCKRETSAAQGDVPAKAAENALAYVSNQDGEVTVIDLASFTTVGSIATGASAPRGIGISADGKWLITANRDAGTISIIERASGRLDQQIAIGENPEFVRVRGQRVFVSFEPASKGGPPPKPGSVEEKEQEEERERERPEPAQIAVVDLSERKVVQRIVGGLETEGIEFSADGAHILVTNEDEDTVTVHRIDTGERVRTLDVSPYGKRPRGIKMAPDGKSYVASIEYGNHLVLIDSQFNLVRAVPTGEVPYGLAFDAKGERLFVALSRGKALQVFDAKMLTPIQNIPTGERCWHFTFTPDERHLLVACGRSHEVVVIDAATLTPIKRIEDKKLPWGIVTWPRSIGSLDVP